MVRGYSLYFDRPRIDWQRRARRATAALIVALHLLVIAWLMVARHPLPSALPSMVVVELNAMTNAFDAAAATRGNNATRERNARLPNPPPPARPVAEGRLAPPNAAASDGFAAVADAVAGTSDSRNGGSVRAVASGHFSAPRVVHHWTPPYPRAAFAAHVEGDVDVLVTIGADGALLDARVDRSSGNASLDLAAVAAVRRYLFKPGTHDGEPIRAQAIVGIAWRIVPGVKVDLDFTLPGDTRDRDVRQKFESVLFLPSQNTDKPAGG